MFAFIEVSQETFTDNPTTEREKLKGSGPEGGCVVVGEGGGVVGEGGGVVGEGGGVVGGGGTGHAANPNT